MCFPGTGNINDGWTILRFNYESKLIVLIIFVIFLKNFVLKICPGRLGPENLKINIQFFFEINSYILNYFLFCGSSKTGYRDRIFNIFLLLKVLNKVSDI